MRESGGGGLGERLSEESRTEVAGVRSYTPGAERAGSAIANT